MYRLTYHNIPNNLKVEEYCFWKHEEKRRLYIDEKGDLKLVSCEKLVPTFLSKEFWKLYWRCLTNYTVQKDWAK